MSENYLKINLPTEPFRKYFLEDYVPNNKVIDQITKSDTFHFKHLMHEKKDKKISELNDLLKVDYKLPFKIQYFIFFYHAKSQHIHIDGTNYYRYCSLNLPLENFKDSKMIFYRQISQDKKIVVSDAFYFDQTQVEKIEEFDSTDNWVLVNSGIPHNIICQTYEVPRLTLCLRFEGNPKFDFVKSCFQKVGLA